MPPATRKELMAKIDMLWKNADKAFEEAEKKSHDKFVQDYIDHYYNKRSGVKIQESEVKQVEPPS
jgi:uncharacterized protein YnzC (UPF0291/DUF896 family)